jgi:hypothetical protein
MEFTKAESFSRQLDIYIRNNEFAEAYALSGEFASRFPEEMRAHYYLAKSAFGLKRFDVVETEGRKAFNLAHTKQDIVSCASLLCTAYFELKEYKRGYDLLSQINCPEIQAEAESLLFMFSIAMGDESAAAKHFSILVRSDKDKAGELISNMLLSLSNVGKTTAL